MIPARLTERLKDLAISESGFLFDPRTGFSFTLNETAQTIFYLLKEGTQEEEILDRLEEEYEAGRDILERDLYDFFSQLKSVGLMTP